MKQNLLSRSHACKYLQLIPLILPDNKEMKINTAELKIAA